MSRYVCIHGHFYQPPRENPWLEAIERQPSAAPYHDWNSRVTAECYRPNLAARVLDEQGRIRRLANNYELLSFDAGPTLMAWLESEAPDVHRALVSADRRATGGGSGAAIAQAYGHAILPLAEARDRRTHVIWGARDFEHRFGRRPEGMWLPETAVDLPTLETLAEEGIRYTILAPHQAARWRPRGAGDRGWRPAGEALDPHRAYVQRLPSGREIALFFYHGPLAHGVAFEGLLRDGDRLGREILEAFDPSADGPQLVHLATDGETFGHHHRHGEMALATALELLAKSEGVELVTYGRYLELHPPEFEVEIVEATSWSCAHGVERWRSDCGCRTGGDPGWDQAWRAPLREALDALRAEVDPRWERAAEELFPDPWKARDGYVDVVLDRSVASVDGFLAEHARGVRSATDRARALRLLELQRYALLVYTSCGWFFNDLAGIETVQVLRYAARVIELGERVFGEPLEPEFVRRLAAARSNRPEMGDGREIWERRVKIGAVNAERVCAHRALDSLVGPVDSDGSTAPFRWYAFRVEPSAMDRRSSGRRRLETGRTRVVSTSTGEFEEFAHAALRLDDGRLVAGVRPSTDGTGRVRSDAVPGSSPCETTDLWSALERGDEEAAVRRLEAAFDRRTFGLADLVPDERRRIADRLLREVVEETAAAIGAVRAPYERLAPLVEELELSHPAAMEALREIELAVTTRRALESDDADLAELARRLETAAGQGIELGRLGLVEPSTRASVRAARRVREMPREAGGLDLLTRAVELSRVLPRAADPEEFERAYWALLEEAFPDRRERATAGDPAAAVWVRSFQALGRRLGFAVDSLTGPPDPDASAATPPPGSSR